MMTLIDWRGFFNIAYQKSSPFFEVNHARQAMFADGVAIENCPPSKGALKQHILRGILISTKWHKALGLRPKLPSPSNWGWIKNKNNILVPHWSDDPIVAVTLQELIRCGYKKPVQETVHAVSMVCPVPHSVNAMC